MKKLRSTVDLINENASRPAETANVHREALRAKQASLQEVSLVGPEGTSIPAYYSPEDRAFLPKFDLDG